MTAPLLTDGMYVGGVCPPEQRYPGEQQDDRRRFGNWGSTTGRYGPAFIGHGKGVIKDCKRLRTGGAYTTPDESDDEGVS